MRTVIDIPTEFSDTPGGRTRSDGPATGERFREDFLVPALKTGGTVEVMMDGALGYGTSFLEEAFGGLVRVHGYSAAELHRRLVVSTSNEIWSTAVWRFINRADRQRP